MSSAEKTSIDASEAAITAAEAGSVPKAKEIKAPAASKPLAPSKAVATTRDTSKGVLLECVQDSGRPRVRVLSKGYHHDWWVQFPPDIRDVGARYVVDAVRETAAGGFYRASGEIRKVQQTAARGRR